MKIILAGFIAAATLAGCGTSGKPAATAPTSSAPSTSVPTASPSLDNYAQIACTDIDKGRASVMPGSVSDRVDAIHDYQAAVLAAMKSADPAVKQEGQAGLVPLDQLGAGQLENRLDGWRSFCESKGWVGTP